MSVGVVRTAGLHHGSVNGSDALGATYAVVTLAGLQPTQGLAPLASLPVHAHVQDAHGGDRGVEGAHCGDYGDDLSLQRLGHEELNVAVVLRHFLFAFYQWPGEYPRCPAVAMKQ